MTCEEFKAMRSSVTPDTPVSQVMAAWRHYQSCHHCRTAAKEAWNDTSEAEKKEVQAISPLLALHYAIRAAGDPEIGGTT